MSHMEIDAARAEYLGSTAEAAWWTVGQMRFHHKTYGEGMPFSGDAIARARSNER